MPGRPIASSASPVSKQKIRPLSFWAMLFGAAVYLLVAVPGLAAAEGGETAMAETKASPSPEARSQSTRHSVEIAGQKIDYTATVGWLILKNDDGAPVARFGYTAYTRDGVETLSQRPVLFAFNGGPGSSSIWLHMGVLGPRRAVVTDEGFTPPPPSHRVDNAYSVLDVTDLVMIDPVGTGFSRPVGEGKGEDFGASIRTFARWALSSRSTSPSTAVGRHRSSSSVRAMAACARRVWCGICKAPRA